MQTFTDLNNLLNNTKSLLLNGESLIDIGVPFKTRILDKEFIMMLDENNNGGLTASIEESSYKYKMEISYDELTKQNAKAAENINEFICTSLGAKLNIEEKNSFILSNSLTKFPTTLSKELILTSYVPRKGFFEKVRQIKLDEKNIELKKDGHVLIKNKGQLFVYIIDEEKKENTDFTEFIRV